MSDTVLLKGFVCPKCRLLVAAKEEQLGEKAACPNCSVILQLPTLTDRISSLKPSEVTGITTAGVVEKADVYTGSWLEAVPDELADEETEGLPWHMLLPAGLVGVILVGVMIFLFTNTQNKAVATLEKRVVAESEAAPPVNDGIDEAQLMELFESLAAANSVEELLPNVVPSPQISEKLEEYYQDKEISFLAPDYVVSQFKVGLRNVFKVSVMPKGEASYWTCYVFLDSEGRCQLDWEAHVQWNDPRWEKIKTEKPEGPFTLRVSREIATYYNHEFTSDKWQGFALRSEASGEVYYGYVEREGSTHIEFGSAVGYEDGAKFTIQVRFPENSPANNQLIIEKVVSPNWITHFTE